MHEGNHLIGLLGSTNALQKLSTRLLIIFLSKLMTTTDPTFSIGEDEKDKHKAGESVVELAGSEHFHEVCAFWWNFYAIHARIRVKCIPQKLKLGSEAFKNARLVSRLENLEAGDRIGKVVVSMSVA